MLMPARETARLYTICHLPLDLPETDLLRPINAERTDGENIAARRDWSELRAQYWVLKNTELPDFVGFFHFRRYLDPAPKRGKRPYRTAERPDPAAYTAAVWRPILAEADIIAPRAEYTGLTVWERYAAYPNHDVRDLQTAVRVLCETRPAYTDAAERYLGGRREYYGNIYIMRSDLFRAYCEWLFPVLEAFRGERPQAGARTEGYLAERLFGVWLTEQESNGGMRVKNLPRVHFTCYNDAAHRTTAFKKLLNFLLPCGSRVRGFFARLRLGKRARRALRGAGIDRYGERGENLGS